MTEEPDKVCPTTIIGQEGLFKLGKANPLEGVSPDMESLVPSGSEFVSLREISRKVLVTI
jgi:hypothetical protein